MNTLLVLLPCIAALVWAFVSARVLVKRRHLTEAEQAFASFTVLMVLSSVSLSLFLAASSIGDAWAYSSALSLFAFLALASLCLFAVRLVERPRHIHLLLFAPAILTTAVDWTMATVVEISPIGYERVRGALNLVVVFVFVGAYLFPTIVQFGRAYSRLSLQSSSSATRVAHLMTTTGGLVGLGYFGDVLFGANRLPFSPFMSAVFLVFSLSFLTIVYQIDLQSLAVRARRAYRGPAEVLSVAVCDQDGHLLAVQDREGLPATDADFLGKTMNVLDSFMKRSFPQNEGTSSRTVVLEDFTIQAERGNRLHLIVLSRGRIDLALRERMRIALRRMEHELDAYMTRGSATVEDKGQMKEFARDLIMPPELL